MRTNNRTHLLFILIIVVLTIIVYANTLKNGFVYDDAWEIVNNNWVKNFQEIFSSCHRYRLTEIFTLFTDYKIWGLNPFGFHLTNLLLHSLTSVAVFLLAYSILHKKWASFIIATLFAVHPIHTEAVSIISHRQEILVMLFIALGLIFFIKQKTSNNYFPLAISCLFFALALGAKEVAFIFPFLLLLYDLYFENKKPKIKYYIPYLAVLGLFLILFSIPSPRWNFKISGFDTVSFGHALSGNRTYASILLTQLKGFTRYVKLLFFPHPLSIDYYFPTYTSIFQDRLILSLLLLLFVVFLAVITYRRYKVISFGIAWFLINLLPVSNILPKTYFVAERYLYIPSFGFCLLLGWILAEGLSKKKTKIISAIIFGLIITFYSIKTVQRNFDFRSEYTLWSETLKRNPKSVHGYNNVGVGFLEKGDVKEAIKNFESAIELAPTFTKTYYNLGIALYEAGDYVKAVENLKTSISLDPKSGESYAALGTVYQKMGQSFLAISNFRTAIQDYGLKQDASLHYSLGIAYRDVGRVDDAIGEFRKAISLNPKLSEVHNDLGIEYGKKGLYDEAIREFEIAVNPIINSPQIYYNLGFAYTKKGEYNKAVQSFQNSIKYCSKDTIYINNVQRIIKDLQKKNAQIKPSTP